MLLDDNDVLFFSKKRKSRRGNHHIALLNYPKEDYFSCLQVKTKSGPWCSFKCYSSADEKWEPSQTLQLHRSCSPDRFVHCPMEEQPYSLLMHKLSATDGKYLKLVVASQIQLATKFIQFSVYMVLYIMTYGI